MLPSTRHINSAGLPLFNVPDRLLQEQEGRLDDHHFFFDGIGHETIVASEFRLDSLHTVRVRFNEASTLRWHVFNSSELFFKKGRQLLLVWLVDSLECLAKVRFGPYLARICTIPEEVGQFGLFVGLLVEVNE